MRESAAQAVLLVRAFEEADPEGRLLPLDDRRRATDAARARALGQGDAAVLEARAQHLLATLDAAVPGIPRLLAGTRILAGLAPVVIAAGFVVGLVVNELGTGHFVQLLPMLFALAALLAWNVTMYVVFAGYAFASRRPAPPMADLVPAPGGRLSALSARVLEWVVGRFARRQVRHRVREAGLVTAAVTRFAASWRRAVAPLLAARARLAFHLGSMALALGIVTGMFVRGLGFRYDVTWESTFLDADDVHAVAKTLLGVAGRLTGRGVPSVAEVAALETSKGHGPAGRWIVLYAVTVFVFVVVPRLLLALLERRTAARLAASLPVDLGATYAARAGGAGAMPGAGVEVLPYSHTPTPRAADALRALLHDVFGTAVAIDVRPAVAYGAEIADVPAPTGGPACRIVLFTSAQTPETEVHGRFVAEAAARRRASDRLVVVVDGSAYRERIGDAARVDERRRLWERIAKEAGAEAVAVDLGVPGREGAERLAAAVRAATAGA